MKLYRDMESCTLTNLADGDLSVVYGAAPLSFYRDTGPAASAPATKKELPPVAALYRERGPVLKLRRPRRVKAVLKNVVSSGRVQPTPKEQSSAEILDTLLNSLDRLFRPSNAMAGPENGARARRLLKRLALASGFALFFLLLMAAPALAQNLSLDFGQAGDGATTARIIQIVALITVLSLAPSLLVMVTSFTRITIVLAFLRTAMGTQGTPPNQVLVSLALFLTFFIMMPAFEKAYDDGIKPLIEERIDEFEAFERSVAPFREFMQSHVREQDLMLFVDIGKIPDEEARNKVPLRALIPAFMISELRRAFEIGFLIFVPFLIIDMVVASVLMSMGMMMLPPIIIALPFKIVFFVLVDGWYMIVGSLVKSFGG